MPEWLTWAQAGERFGISAGAARMRAHRLKWRTMPGNDGRTRVEVPDDAVARQRRAPAQLAEPAAERASVDRLTALLADALDRVGQAEQRAEAERARADQVHARAERAEHQAEAERARADAADADRRTAEQRADRADAGRDGEVRRADVLRHRIELLQADLAAAQEDAYQARDAAREAEIAAEAIREIRAARRTRGLLARLRAALWGE